MRQENRFPLVQRLTGKLLVLFFCIGVLLQLLVSTQAAPANFGVLVDTSGSMTGLYQRRDPRPTLVLELVQSLITETMRPGDRLVVMPFDTKVHNQPGEFVAIEKLQAGAVLAEVEKLQLQPQGGKGTAKTAALGAGAKALRALVDVDKNKHAGFGGGIIYVVTDTDNDVVPADAAGKALYTQTRQMLKAGGLVSLARIPQSGIILEVWQLKSTPGLPQPRLETTISKVQALLKGILPDHIVTNGPLTADFENGKLSLKPEGAWQRTANGFALPVSLQSQFKLLHFKGEVQPNIKVTGAQGSEHGTARLELDGKPSVIAPGASLKGKLLLTGLAQPGLLSWSPAQYRIEAKPAGKGVATTEPKLFEVPNPAAAARISDSIWVDPWTPGVQFSPALPALPPLSPPHGLQLLLGALLLAVLVGGWKITHPTVAPLRLHYKVDQAPVAQLVSLSKADAGYMMAGAQAHVKRCGREERIVITPAKDAQLLDASGKEHAQMEFDRGAFFYVHSLGRDIAVSFDFGKEPPAPPALRNQASGGVFGDDVSSSRNAGLGATVEERGSSTNSTSDSRGDVWG